MGDQEPSKTKQKVEEALENLRTLHEKDALKVLKELKAYQKAIQAAALQGQKLASELNRFGERSQNEWGAGFHEIGDVVKDVEVLRENLSKSLQEDCVSPLSTILSDDTKYFNKLDSRMRDCNKEFDSCIQKLFVLTQKKRTMDPSIMRQSMEELTNAVAEADKKREEMLVELSWLEKDRMSAWFKSWVQSQKAETEFFEKANSKMSEFKSSWSTLSEKTTATFPVSTWHEDLNCPSLGLPKEKKVREERKERPQKPDKPKKDITKKEPKAISPHKSTDSEEEKSDKIKRKSIFQFGSKDKSKSSSALQSKPKSLPTPPTTPNNVPSKGMIEAVSIKARVLFNYDAQRPDELDLKEGEKILVVGKQIDNWWIGVTKDGKQGVFPSTFVVPEEDEEDKNITSPPNSPSSKKNTDSENLNSPIISPSTSDSSTTSNNTMVSNVALAGNSSSSLSLNSTDWEECFSENGEKYYYNHKTAVSSWEVPEEFLKQTTTTTT